MYKYLSSQKNERVLSKQVLRSGTSVGANVNESRNAQSTSDFISMNNDIQEIVRILVKIIKTTKERNCI